MPSPIGNDTLCGARTRSGKPCKNKAMQNGRCAKHGGKSTGPPKGSRNALKHGIYATGLRDDEKEIWHEVDVESVDDEVRLIKIQIRRAFIALRGVEDDPNDEVTGFELAEIKRKSGEYAKPGKGESAKSEPPDVDASEEEIQEWEAWLENGEGDGERGDLKVSVINEAIRIKRRPDYRTIIYRLLGRLAQLMDTRSRLGAGLDPGESARKIQAFLHQLEDATAGVGGDDPAPDTP